MKKTILAGCVYCAVVLGTGFVLGTIRVPLLVPRIGERWAELAEMPVMGAVIYFAAGYILQHFPEVNARRRSLAVGFIALALAVCAELGLAAVLQRQTVAEYIGSRDRISGSVYLILLLVFALMPRLRCDGALPSKVMKLRMVKLIHTAVWALFVTCILAIPVASTLGQFRNAAWLVAIVFGEVVVLIFTSWSCPLTAVAVRYTTDRSANFAIYLPARLVRHNKSIFGVLYGAGIVIATVQWTRA
jgi:hypothetical protein